MKPKSERTRNLLHSELRYSGAYPADREKLRRLFARLESQLLQDGGAVPEGPCDGAQLVSIHAYWQCDAGTWNLHEDTVWRCADGTIERTHEIVEFTEDECRDLFPG
jgi:hypothetical protein